MITRENREGEGRMSKEQRQSVENLLRTTVVGREADLAFWNEADSKTAREEATYCERDIAAYRAALAILTDEAEADRALGAKVRAALPFLPGSEEINARHMDAGALTLDDYEDTEGPCDVLRAIADALREEGGR